MFPLFPLFLLFRSVGAHRGAIFDRSLNTHASPSVFFPGVFLGRSSTPLAFAVYLYPMVTNWSHNGKNCMEPDTQIGKSYAQKENTRNLKKR